MSDTSLFENVNAEHFKRLSKAASLANIKYQEAIMSNQTNWVVVAIPME
ncbi:aminopeptidase [bacterium]|nr:aminopeptidase [bacterium]